MIDVIKVLGNTANLAVTNTTPNVHCISIINLSTGVSTITIFDTVANVQVGSFPMIANERRNLQLKNGYAVTSSNTLVQYTPVAFTN